ncbi:helix-turn-helix domain-containing protein [Clostridium tertium]|uniref:helix-turn-helix domain-containing protein n=1 Tax=Clostridium tertium TaxID=1559 RepID=UPI0015969F4E|nr:helix-turn-helix domain-containing protein [Clostridium tertium]MDB1924144.1 helix-turn-helix domain-containing protein [Clostridium tertium]MDB1927343.1 helix-turn-helix domain-containing protein [Clostridium tertium]MDB1931119.1 helix-turn-helix domain-containing protein [Clostridium tertium]
MNQKEIGKKIKSIRESQGLTREEFAQKLNVSVYTVANYEQGQRGSNTNTLKKIANALGVSELELLSPGKIGKHFAEEKNKEEKEINLLFDLLKIRYGEENININEYIDEQFVELYIQDKKIVYTKQDFEKFIDYVSTIFPTFKMILDNQKK